MALEETMRHYALPYSDEILALYSAGNDAQWKLLEQGKVQRSEIGYRRFDLLLTHLGSDLDREEVNHYYMERLSNRHFFLPGAEELLCALHGRYTLCLASNGTGWVQEGRLKTAAFCLCWTGCLSPSTWAPISPNWAFSTLALPACRA